MTVRLVQRQLSPVQSLEPGQYTTETKTGEPAIRCPECGGVADIEHRVLPGGAVALIWQCPYVCTYAAFLQLEDWDEPVLK